MLQKSLWFKTTCQYTNTCARQLRNERRATTPFKLIINPLITLISRFEFVDETENTTADDTVNMPTVQMSNENVNVSDHKSTKNNRRTV